MNKLTMNNDNKRYYSDEYIRGWENGAQAQYTADIESMPKGEWIDREQCQVDEDAYEVATCSNCKSEITIEYPYDNYCPNCGANMRGEDNAR